jgi:hypothetical protein
MNLGYRSHCPPLVLFVLVISLDIFFSSFILQIFEKNPTKIKKWWCGTNVH